MTTRPEPTLTQEEFSQALLEETLRENAILKQTNLQLRLQLQKALEIEETPEATELEVVEEA